MVRTYVVDDLSEKKKSDALISTTEKRKPKDGIRTTLNPSSYDENELVYGLRDDPATP